MNLFLRRLGTSSLIAAIAAALAGPASASEANRSPIEIQSCTPIQASTPANFYAMGVSYADSVEITFVNRGPLPAESVTFSVSDDSGMTAVEDRGTFAPGVLIRHTFSTGNNVDGQVCRVAAAQFAGGLAFVADEAPKHGNR